MIGPDFNEAFCRHLREQGLVPPEFEEEQRIPEFRMTWGLSRMSTILSRTEQNAIEDAAHFAHRGAPRLAEAARERGGYNGLGGEPTTFFTNNDPLD